MAREAVLCGPQGLFARLISLWKGLLSSLWQIQRSIPKPSVWFFRNQHGFAAKTFFFKVFAYFLGQIPVKLAKVSNDFVQRNCNYLEFNLGKNARGPQ